MLLPRRQLSPNSPVVSTLSFLWENMSARCQFHESIHFQCIKDDKQALFQVFQVDRIGKRWRIKKPLNLSTFQNHSIFFSKRPFLRWPIKNGVRIYLQSYRWLWMEESSSTMTDRELRSTMFGHQTVTCFCNLKRNKFIINK